jgi:multidrug efflux pump subunit AcrA (membrane-fusion protein)
MLSAFGSRAWLGIAVIAVVAVAGVALMSARDPDPAGSGQSGRRQSTFAVARKDFVRSIRLNGTVEAVQATTISVPRLAGQNTPSLIVTRLIRAGAAVKPGDLLVEFDRQDQLKNALDRRVELNDLEQQIRKKEAEERAARAKDESELKQAETGEGRARLELAKNEFLPKIQAEKNEQAVEEAVAKLAQLKKTFDLKRKAAEADLRILQIRRDRAENAMKQAESNAEKMAILSPIGGMAVVRSIWKSNTMAEIQEGEEVRSGMPVVDVVNPSMMRVRSKVNQADINDLKVGQAVRMGLDAYPTLSFNGRVSQISPLAVRSTLSAKVRTFIVLIDVEGSHPNLMPDLTASLDVELARVPRALVVPRDSVRLEDGKAFVSVRTGSRYEERAVTVSDTNGHETVVSSGLDEGVTIARNVDPRGLGVTP